MAAIFDLQQTPTSESIHISPTVGATDPETVGVLRVATDKTTQFPPPQLEELKIIGQLNTLITNTVTLQNKKRQWVSLETFVECRTLYKLIVQIRTDSNNDLYVVY